MTGGIGEEAGSPFLDSLACRSRRSSRSRRFSRCLLLYADAILSLISFSCPTSILSRSISSSSPSSMICLIISSSIIAGSSSDALRSERRLDWCSICLGGTDSLVDGEGSGFLLLDRLVSSRCLVSRLRSRLRSLLLSLLLRSLGGSKVLLGMPTSLKLIC